MIERPVKSPYGAGEWAVAEQEQGFRGAERAEDRLREVLAELWSRRVRVAGLRAYEYVIPVDAELAHRVRQAFVEMMEFGGRSMDQTDDEDAPAR